MATNKNDNKTIHLKRIGEILWIYHSDFSFVFVLGDYLLNSSSRFLLRFLIDLTQVSLRISSQRVAIMSTLRSFMIFLESLSLNRLYIPFSQSYSGLSCWRYMLLLYNNFLKCVLRHCLSRDSVLLVYAYLKVIFKGCPAIF